MGSKNGNIWACQYEVERWQHLGRLVWGGTISKGWCVRINESIPVRLWRNTFILKAYTYLYENLLQEEVNMMQIFCGFSAAGDEIMAVVPITFLFNRWVMLITIAQDGNRSVIRK